MGIEIATTEKMPPLCSTWKATCGLLEPCAQICDVNLQNADREELYDVDRFYEKMIRVVKAPTMIDTTDPRAVELSLTYCQGKSLVNSINLEDGEEKFERLCPMARAYGAALIVGCIDEDKQQAQAFTRERKLAIAQRSYSILTEKYGIPPEDIVFDPLVSRWDTQVGDLGRLRAGSLSARRVRASVDSVRVVGTAPKRTRLHRRRPDAAQSTASWLAYSCCCSRGCCSDSCCSWRASRSH